MLNRPKPFNTFFPGFYGFYQRFTTDSRPIHNRFCGAKLDGDIERSGWYWTADRYQLLYRLWQFSEQITTYCRDGYCLVGMISWGGYLLTAMGRSVLLALADAIIFNKRKP